MKISKKHIGKIVNVVFLDHAMRQDLVVCEVWGRLVFVDDDSIIVRFWESDSGKDPHDSNHEICSIIISTIKKYRVMR